MLELNHKKLDVWNKSIELVTEIYRVTKFLPKEEIFGLSSQLRRASVSVISNIAEGSARKSSLERKRFYEISRSSLVEIDAQIEIAQRLSYINIEQIDKLNILINQIFAMMSKLIQRT
ncbi:MAG: four helix bundle protein [Ignavibacteriales bacterium]|nr:MAG: four helix bundle protein [Ignavibacteriales bacterium]